MNNQNQSKFFSKGISTPIGILIIVIITLLIGGILGWQWWRVKEEVKMPEIKAPEELVKVKVYFHNYDLYKKLEQELCPEEYCPGEMYEKYGVDDCEYVFPVTRMIPKPKTKQELVRLVLEELQKGPTKEEETQGFNGTEFGEMIKDFKIENGFLRVKLDKEKVKEWEKILSPRTIQDLASCEERGYFAPLRHTLSQIPGIAEASVGFPCEFYGLPPELCE